MYLNGQEIDGVGDAAAWIGDFIKDIIITSAEMQKQHNEEIAKFIAETEKYENHDDVWDILWDASPQ